ncbi:hypothetical protein KC356_g258 [Hortaea werneckii]|nr:hypothetical protein KC356_g258 [Hortaea werneckii]
MEADVLKAERCDVAVFWNQWVDFDGVISTRTEPNKAADDEVVVSRVESAIIKQVCHSIQYLRGLVRPHRPVPLTLELWNTHDGGVPIRGALPGQADASRRRCIIGR